MSQLTDALRRSAITATLLAGACGGGVGAGANDPALVSCVEPGVTIPPGAWVCGTDRTVECSSPLGAEAGTLVVVPVALGASSAPPCGAVTLTSSTPAGPFALGDHVITVSEQSSSLVGIACTSTLHVVDTTPPGASPRTVELWPPNHEMHDVAIGDCVQVADVCDEAVAVRFTYVSSDEAVDAHGSGHSDPDVELVDCAHVRVRAERTGGSDGRVYRLGYEATDHAGNRTTGSCRVVVPHDQSGDAPVEGAQAYRLDLAAACP